jgi:hypothetical protein
MDLWVVEVRRAKGEKKEKKANLTALTRHFPGINITEHKTSGNFELGSSAKQKNRSNIANK